MKDVEEMAKVSEAKEATDTGCAVIVSYVQQVRAFLFYLEIEIDQY